MRYGLVAGVAEPYVDQVTITIELHQHFRAAPERVWSLISDFYALHTWLPAVVATREDASTRTRLAVLPDGGEVAEQLLEEGDRFHRYRVTGGPMPVEDFVAEIRVLEVDGGTSEVRWQASFAPAGLPAADAEAIIAGVFRGGLDNLTALLAEPVAS